MVLWKRAAILVISFIIIASIFTLLPATSKAMPDSFKLYISRDSVDFNSFVVSGAVLSVPGVTTTQQPKIEITKSFIKIDFPLPRALWENSEKISKIMVNRESYPTITLILTDYKSHKTLNIIVPSTYIAYEKLKEDNVENPLAQALNKLKKDPLTALRYGEFTITPARFEELRRVGLAVEANHVIGDSLPLFKWEKEAVTKLKRQISITSSCNGYTYIGGYGFDLYYAKNNDHPAANEPMPQWWADRMITNDESLKESRWEWFRDHLVAAIYLAPANVDPNTVVQALSSYVFNSEYYEANGTTSLYSLEGFVGSANWNNTFSNGFVYAGLLPLFSLSVTAPDDASDDLILDETIFTFSSLGYTSGLLVDGFYVSSSSTAQSNIASYHTIEGLGGNFDKYFYVWGLIESPGDYIVVAWKFVDNVTCGGTTYRVIIPDTIVTPLYTISLNLSKIYVFDEPQTGVPDFLTSFGVSKIADIRYSHANYSGKYGLIYEYKVQHTSQTINAGYQALIGNPVFKFILALMDYAVDDPYGETLIQIASILLNTGYINANYNAQGSLIQVYIWSNEDPGNTIYDIDIYNAVPKALDGTKGVDWLSWGQLTISVSSSSSGGGGPGCGPSACPLNQTTHIVNPTSSATNK